ncbi:hypothetical protein [Pedobacter sp. NJ-S-72]
MIKEALDQLEQTGIGPVIKVLEKKEHFKIIVLAFQSGMELKAHKTAVPARLLILEGQVTYLEEGRSVTLTKFDDHQIPINIQHSVMALEDSLCLLISRIIAWFFKIIHASKVRAAPL